MRAKDRIIVALDVSSMEEARRLVGELALYVGCFKVGLELLTSEGAPQVVKEITKLGGRVFYDGKFHDIPNTVAAASRAVTRMGVRMFNVHCLGLVTMMKAAKEASYQVAVKERVHDPFVLGVTILTSVKDKELASLIPGLSLNNLVVDLALLAEKAGLDGVIASPREASRIREATGGRYFQIVTPGIRPAYSAKDDQARITTPADAIRNGSDFLVIGRPITQPPTEIGSPVEAAKRIVDEIASV